MKRFLDFLRIIITSPEVAFVVWVRLSHCICPELFLNLGQHLSEQHEYIQYIFLIPGVFLATSFGMRRKILFPHDHNKILTQWPKYQILVDRVHFGIITNTLMFIGSLFTWLFIDVIDPDILVLLTVSFLSWGLIVTGTLMFASTKVRELVERHD